MNRIPNAQNAVVAHRLHTKDRILICPVISSSSCHFFNIVLSVSININIFA